MLRIMKTMPQWNVPGNLQEIIAEDEDNTWENEQWEPIHLRVVGGTIYKGREIPLAWEIELSLDDDFFDDVNPQLEAIGIEADGYGWLELIEHQLSKDAPSLAEKIHTGDTESSACVIWVESEEDCRQLIEIVWELLHDNERISSTKFDD
jgi:hypothetical protein